MSDPERCPRCAARRIEGVDTCPRCQWRFTVTATPPPGPTIAVHPAAAQQTEALPSRPEPIRVQYEAMDRRAMARMSANAMRVRCLGSAGGCLGGVLGAILGFYVSAVVTQNALIGAVGAFVGFAGGAWLGAFLALRLLAR